jgi:hypothetical protein
MDTYPLPRGRSNELTTDPATLEGPTSSAEHGTRATLNVRPEHWDVFFRSSRGPVSTAIEPFLVAALIPAMRAGQPLKVAGSVTPGLLHNLRAAQEILCVWDPSLHSVPIDAGERPPVSGDGRRGVGSFFSGGVDSFYTLLKHQDEITTIVLVHGFDFSLGDTLLREKVSAAARDVAAALDKTLIEVETNLKDFSDRFAKWGPAYHGAALAGVAHFLTPQLSKVYIPATHTYADLFPWGSHPILDPLWGSEEIAFVHDGNEATRVDKVRLIAKYELPMRHLRVCCVTSPGSYNCGRCEKCLRTMVNLRVVGALDRCESFPSLDLVRVSRIAASDANSKSFLEENYRATCDMTSDPALEKALREALMRRYDRGMWLMLRKAHDACWPQHPALADSLDKMLHGRALAGAKGLIRIAASRLSQRPRVSNRGDDAGD